MVAGAAGPGPGRGAAGVRREAARLIPRWPLRRQLIGVRSATIPEINDMAGHSPCGGFSRRRLLAGISALSALEGVRLVSAAEPQAAAKPAGIREKLGIPGPYPGRVIEVRNPGMIRGGVKSREPIQQSVARGMKELTGADDATEAWRSFFEPGDVVGIKVVPNGHPMAPTSPELVLEVIEGLKSAGVKTS